jgi:DNA-binding MltR family transcriptional regulator
LAVDPSKISKISKTLETLSEKLADFFDSSVKLMDGHVAIVGAASMDRNLERAIQTKMRELSRDMKDRLFDGYGPLSNFAAKIDVAFALGVIEKDIYDDLRTVNRLRVKFAHSGKITNFADPKIAEVLAQLSGLDPAIPDMKHRFLARLKQIDLFLDGVYVAYCKATGQPPTDVDPSLLS